MLRIGYNDINCVGSGTIYNLFWNNLLYILIGVCIGIFLFVLIKQLQKEVNSQTEQNSDKEVAQPYSKSDKTTKEIWGMQ